MRLLYFISICWMAAIAGCAGSAEPVGNDRRLIYNNDGTEILGNNWFGRSPLTIDDLNQYIDMVTGSQITTCMICTGSDFFYYRSKFGRLIGDDLNGRLNCRGDTVLNNTFHRFYNNAIRLDKEGTDIIETVLKGAKKSWFITYGMNDRYLSYGGLS